MSNFFQSLFTLSLVAGDRLTGRIEALKGEKGASAVEYAILVGLLAAAVVIAVTAFGSRLQAFFAGIKFN